MQSIPKIQRNPVLSLKQDTSNGIVTLKGTIGSAISEDLAVDDAWVSGVTSVDQSGLKVDPKGHQAEHQAFTDATRSDSDIKLAVQASLHADPLHSALGWVQSSRV